MGKLTERSEEMIDQLASSESAPIQQLQQREAPSQSPLSQTTPVTRRVNVNFSKSAYETLDQLAVIKGKSMSEVLRDAIQLEKWLTDAQEEGWHVLLEKKGQVREVVRF